MASRGLIRPLVLASVMLLFAARQLRGPAVAAEKVELSLYYESLCPYCANFIVNQLSKLFQSDLISVVDLRLVPWGNTQRASNNSWICQHGPDECMLNIVEACAINVLPQQVLRFRFVQCIELLELQGRHNQWQSCIGLLKIYPKPLMDCYQSRTGYGLELKYAEETDNLNPPHRFVPWLTVNNKPLEEDYPNFVAYICKAYQGPDRPRTCNSGALEVNSPNTENSSHQVCYNGKGETVALFMPERRQNEQNFSSIGEKQGHFN